MEIESPQDAWQRRLHDGVYDFGVALAALHRGNPWPEHPLLDAALIQLATELWDHGFSQTEIRRAYEAALAELPGYAAGEERRR